MNTDIMATKRFTGLDDELHEAAIRETALDDFGDPAYRRGLRVMLDAVDTDLQLTQTGWRYAYQTFFLRPLMSRLYTEKGWAEHPEVFANPIERPLVIIGIPRTGTTALHRLLSIDQQFQGLEYWLTQTPMIRPLRETWETNQAYKDCVTHLEAVLTLVPQLRNAHSSGAGQVEECGAVLHQSFVYSALYHLLPTYGRWCLAQSARESYRRYADVLRLIGGRESHKRWLLKAPHHMFEIDSLLDVFPDACIIQTHRDPLKAIPSYCSLTHMSHSMLEGDAARGDTLGPQMCALWSTAMDQTQAAREKSPLQFFDVDHRRLLAEPLYTVRSLYEYFGLTLAPYTEQKMRAWVAANSIPRPGKHHYSLDQWGVTPAQICDTFADYRAQHQFN
jgi:hypothetical protein